MTSAESPADCSLCPRLAEFRGENKANQPRWHNAPVDSFGDRDASLLIVGLAPGLRGANRTGRPFTGDFAGDLLYASLLRYGFAIGVYDARADDGLRLVQTRITNAVRCVPPKNKPTGREIATCRRFLKAEINGSRNLQAILALGRIAHDSVVRAQDRRLKDHPFTHGGQHRLGGGLTLFDSYHCSRYNTNTGRLTAQMFEDVISAIRQTLTDSAADCQDLP